MSDKDESSPRASRSPSRSPSEERERSRSPEPREEARRSRSRSPAPARKEDASNPGNNLYVANLAPRVNESDLLELFSKYGRVEKSEVILDPVTKESRGFGFVTFEDIRDAEDAVKEMNGKEMQGRTIRVEHAKRKRGHEKTPGQYLGPKLASVKYGRDRERVRDRSRDRRRSRSRDRRDTRGRYDDRSRGRYDDRDRGRYDDRERGRGGRDSYDDRRSRR